ncbi:endonuclease III [Melioribacteraceae bacterium 4301-Me]|uniref:endonuclease III domain-containing protein n=1 Tax=Pyranulibacter aquaticus TaxID=3163344 RepID=UPI00359B7637
MTNFSAKINKINKLLINKFGLPKRAATPPEPVDLLIATILSQNTNDNNSYRAFQNLKNKFPQWIDLLKVKRTVIEKLIRVAGLGEQKSFAIKNLISNLYKENGKITLDYLADYTNKDAIDNLIRFKGVGVKTASCVLLFSMNRNVCPVDTHVHRTLNRLGIVSATNPDKTFYLLNEKLPEGIAHSLHTNLIRLGREICKPKNPSCGVCPLNSICIYKLKNINNKKENKKRDFMLLDNV